MYQTLISVEDMIRHYDQQDWVLIDCRYDLGDPSAGRNAYLKSHVQGAIYADVHDHLSGKPATDYGRHPLPTAAKLRKVFTCFGIDAEKQVVVYDASSGAFAARLWWLLRYMGHEAVALLDGGWQAWQSSLQPIEAGEKQSLPARFCGEARSEWLVVIDDVPASSLLVDSRDGARYRGEVEPIDAVAGHIPAAINHCWQENLTESGYFLDAEQLRLQFCQIYADTPPSEVVFYCGSGVTACHNLLAVAHAGLPAGRLYAGSWSEWCKAPDRPFKTGPD